MATEEGIVTKLGGSAGRKAWVKTVQSSACNSCSARDSCHQESQGKEREVEAINLVNARVGDLIQISIETGALLKATFLLYVFPIICMLIGGLMGHEFGLHLKVNPSVVSLLLAAVCFLGAMCIVRIRAGRMALKLEYRPKITRIISRAGVDPAAAGNPKPCTFQVVDGV
jgi:sigma-E factor negative regulatory protein RseC